MVPNDILLLKQYKSSFYSSKVLKPPLFIVKILQMLHQSSARFSIGAFSKTLNSLHLNIYTIYICVYDI